jgi:hypothetical protein
VTFRLQITCDHSGCDAKVLMDDDNLAPVVAENLQNPVRAMFVIGSGWLVTPDGWTFGADGARCPEHGENDALGAVP